MPGTQDPEAVEVVVGLLVVEEAAVVVLVGLTVEEVDEVVGLVVLDEAAVVLELGRQV